MTLPARHESEQLLTTYIKNPALLRHCRMVAAALEAYAKSLQEDVELWYATGLLHDLDWEMYPEEHPNRALSELLSNYPDELRQAVAAHAPDRTGIQPTTRLDNFLFACDEICGFMNAVSLLRPNRFTDMTPKSVKKKLKDISFAANVSRHDIGRGFALIHKTPDEHIQFLIDVFKNM